MIERIKRRAQIIRQLRAFFDERGFVEVTTPVAIAAPAPEPHIDCPAVAGPSHQFLRASPELQMKKLLAAGMDKLYQLGPCFREGELGSRHNPEFTMLEWYRRDATYLDIKADLEKLLPRLSSTFSLQSSTLRVREAYRKYAGWDPWVDEWNQDRFDFDMATKIEPAIKAMGGGVFLLDYPPQAASLSKLSSPRSTSNRDLAPYAERWEFYYNGIELANCFTELCDGDEQRRRFLAAKAERRQLGESDYPIDEEFLEIVPLMRSAAGVALGVDRLVAAVCGVDDIHSVMCGE